MGLGCNTLPPRRAPLPVTPLLAIAHDQCSAYCPFSIQRFSLDPDPWPLGWTAPQQSFAAFPRFSSLIATPTSVHVSMSLGCNVEKSKGPATTRALRPEEADFRCTRMASLLVLVYR